MNLKTLLKSICFCDTCYWKITIYKECLCIYTSQHKHLNYMFDYSEHYLGASYMTDCNDKVISKEHIEYIINNGLSNYFDKHKI